MSAAAPEAVSASVPQPGLLSRRAAIIVFLAFAAAYFCSTLVRAITATLAPALTQEFSLHARDLGLLAGGYFLGFAVTQLPLGTWLDRFGPKRVILCFLALAVLGCLAFSAATNFTSLLLARVLLGMGVSACLMAPLTGYRRWLEPATLLRANSWMLMTGSLGMLASTLPVQWLMPLTGWRPLFWILAALVVLAMAAIAWVVPPWKTAPTFGAGVSSLPPEGAALARVGPSLRAAASTPAGQGEAPAVPAGYAQIWRNRYFRKLSAVGFFNYGGMVAIQTLWAGPWLLRVAGYTPLEAATGLFWINACMLVTFWVWGMVNPWLLQHRWPVDRLIGWGVPVSMGVLLANIALGPGTGWAGWALFCMASSVLSLAQPAVGMAFPAALAGRALTAYNLVVFAGIFVMQWGFGLLIDAFRAVGLSDAGSFQATMGVYLCCCIASYVYFLRVKIDPSADNPPQ